MHSTIVHKFMNCSQNKGPKNFKMLISIEFINTCKC